MIKTISDINKEVMKRLNKDFPDKSGRDGLVVIRGITRAIQMTLRAGNIMSFGSFWIYPKKIERFRKRNRKTVPNAKAGRIIQRHKM